MTLLFVDGFDHLAAADLSLKWPQSVSQASISSTNRYGTGKSISLPNSLSYVDRGLGGNYATLVAGVAYNIGSWSVDTWNLLHFLDVAGAGAVTFQCAVTLTPTGRVSAYRNTTVLGTSTASGFHLGWHYVEVKATFHGSTGSMTIRMDGVQVLALTGLNTAPSGNNYANYFRLGYSANFYGGNNYTDNVLYDDLYLLSTAGSVNNDFLGERRIFTLYPSGASADGSGAHTQWTLGGTTPAATNYQSVNESTPDSDVTYVSSNTVNQKDTYAFGDLPAGAGSINAVQFNHIVRKDDAPTRTIAPLQRNGGSDAAGTTSGPLTPTYADILTLHENSLLTSSPWTASEINASEFGVQLIS